MPQCVRDSAAFMADTGYGMSVSSLYRDPVNGTYDSENASCQLESCRV